MRNFFEIDKDKGKYKPSHVEGYRHECHVLVLSSILFLSFPLSSVVLVFVISNLVFSFPYFIQLILFL